MRRWKTARAPWGPNIGIVMGAHEESGYRKRTRLRAADVGASLELDLLDQGMSALRVPGSKGRPGIAAMA